MRASSRTVIKYCIILSTVVLSKAAFFEPNEAQAVAAIWTLGLVLYESIGTKEDLEEREKLNLRLLSELARSAEISSITGRLNSYFEMRRLRAIGGRGETKTEESTIAREEIPIIISRLEKLGDFKLS